MAQKTLILQMKYGGLGDHLFYSHIPRIAKETGAYDRVLISDLSEFRHPSYRALIWEKNPYVDGFTDLPGIGTKPVPVDTLKGNILDATMIGLGLDDEKRFHEPELYFKPAKRTDLDGSVVYDPNYVSFVGNFASSDLDRWVARHSVSIDFQMKLRDKCIPLKKAPPQELASQNLEDFCSIIVSCEQLYCLTSGTATLAAALNKPAIVFHGADQKKDFHHSKLHRYVSIPESLKNKSFRLIKTYKDKAIRGIFHNKP